MVFMAAEQRKCVVHHGSGMRDIEGVFIQYGTKIVYDEGNQAHSVTTAIVEADDGQVHVVAPEKISFPKA